MSTQRTFGAVSGRPLFVGGCARSGTTLLRTMLNNHPDLGMPHETKFVISAWRQRDTFGDLRRAENREAVARWILDEPKSKFVRLGIEPDDLVADFAAAPPTLGSLLATCFMRYAEQTGKTRWGDKRPSYSLNLEAMFRMFPDAQFVHVVRDPRACAVSMRKAWADWGRVASAAEVWERTDREVQAASRRLRPDQFMQIRYEDLVATPEEVLDRICGFAGLATGRAAEMLDYHRTDPTSLPGGWLYERAAQPLDGRSVARWTTELDEKEVAFLERVLHERLVVHGYDLTAGGAPVPEDLVSDYRQVRNERNRVELRRRLVEMKRRVTYRRPTAMRLVSAR